MRAAVRNPCGRRTAVLRRSGERWGAARARGSPGGRTARRDWNGLRPLLLWRGAEARGRGTGREAPCGRRHGTQRAAVQAVTVARAAVVVIVLMLCRRSCVGVVLSVRAHASGTLRMGKVQSARNRRRRRERQHRDKREEGEPAAASGRVHGATTLASARSEAAFAGRNEGVAHPRIVESAPRPAAHGGAAAPRSVPRRTCPMSVARFAPSRARRNATSARRSSASSPSGPSSSLWPGAAPPPRL